jgi:hypothetical protein
MNQELNAACRHLLWTYGDQENGQQPGGFMTALITAWEHADHVNQFKLSNAFPELGAAVSAFKSGGREALIAMLAGH